MNGEKIQVVGVCGNEATIYNMPDKWGFRAFVRREQFSNYGQARQFAVEFEEKQRSQRKVVEETEARIKRKSHKHLQEGAAQ